MFAVDDIDETLERLRTRGAQLVGEVVQYKTRTGSATSAGLKGFSSDSPRTRLSAHRPATLEFIPPMPAIRPRPPPR